MDGDSTILQAPSDGNVSVHVTKAAKSPVVAVLGVSLFLSPTLKRRQIEFFGSNKLGTWLNFVQCILSS